MTGPRFFFFSGHRSAAPIGPLRSPETMNGAPLRCASCCGSRPPKAIQLQHHGDKEHVVVIISALREPPAAAGSCLLLIGMCGWTAAAPRERIPCGAHGLGAMCASARVACMGRPPDRLSGHYCRRSAAGKRSPYTWRNSALHINLILPPPSSRDWR